MKDILSIYIDSWKNFGNAKGTMSRSDFWKFYFLHSFFVVIVSVSLEADTLLYTRICQYAFLFGSLVLSLCNMIKRLRDANLNTANILWNFVPIVGNIYLLFLLTKKSNHNNS